MIQLTIRGVDNTLHNALRDAAQAEGISVNRYILDLLYNGIGVSHKPIKTPIFHDLDALGGTWNEAESEAFDHALAETRQIDDGLWR